MDNNDVLRSLRYAFDYDDSVMMDLCSSSGKEISRSEVCSWLKREGAEGYIECSDLQLSTFLNALIIDKRGEKDGPTPLAEPSLTNNIIFRKLRIALNLKDEDIVEILGLVDFKVSKGELNAFFRKTSHKNFRKCKDQILRNFLNGIRLKYRPNKKTD
jgi:uncharacterized protein YehS (DUF1456 family)